MLIIIVALALTPAELVVEHALIWSGGKMTASRFLAVSEGRFVYVGKANPAYIGPKTVRIDAHNKVLLPGFIDSHAHFMSGGQTLTSLDLRGANTKAEFLRRIKDRAEHAGDDDTIIGNSWSAESWPDHSQPTRQDLDSVTGEHATILYRMDGHSLIVNSVALRKMKITKDSASPAGGSIDKDPITGEPTGLLRETAMRLVGPIMPPITEKAMMAGLGAAIHKANGYGITAISEICSTADFAKYAGYGNSPGRSLRFGLYPVATNWSYEIRAIQNFKGVPGWVQANGIKAYMDGSLGSRTAWMLEPYTKPLPDQKSPTGLPRPGFSDGSYARGIHEAAGAGFQVIVHAIGDRANREILNLFEQQAPNLKNLRFRVEHAQHLSAQDIPRFGQLEVIASMQPYHKADDGRYCEEVIGTARSRTSYAYKDILSAGGRLAFGSDWPVVDDNPWLGIETAVTGRILTGKAWMTHENISLDQALSGYTTEGAYAMKREGDLGQIKVGYRADFQILNASPFASSAELDQVRPDMLFVDGRRVAL